jgi:hypothetical protein
MIWLTKLLKDIDGFMAKANLLTPPKFALQTEAATKEEIQRREFEQRKLEELTNKFLREHAKPKAEPKENTDIYEPEPEFEMELEPEQNKTQFSDTVSRQAKINALNAKAQPIYNWLDNVDFYNEDFYNNLVIPFLKNYDSIIVLTKAIAPDLIEILRDSPEVTEKDFEDIGNNQNTIVEAANSLIQLQKRSENLLKNSYIKGDSDDLWIEEFDVSEFLEKMSALYEHAKAAVDLAVGEDFNMNDAQAADFAAELNGRQSKNNIDKSERLTFTGDKIKQQNDAQRNHRAKLREALKVGDQHKLYQSAIAHGEAVDRYIKKVKEDPTRYAKWLAKRNGYQKKYTAKTKLIKHYLEEYNSTSNVRDRESIARKIKELALQSAEQRGHIAFEEEALDPETFDKIRKRKELEQKDFVKEYEEKIQKQDQIKEERNRNVNLEIQEGKKRRFLSDLLKLLGQKLASKKGDRQRALKKNLNNDRYFIPFLNEVDESKTKLDEAVLATSKAEAKLALDVSNMKLATAIKNRLEEDPSVKQIIEISKPLYDLKDRLNHLLKMNIISDDYIISPDHKNIVSDTLQFGNIAISNYMAIFNEDIVVVQTKEILEKIKDGLNSLNMPHSESAYNESIMFKSSRMNLLERLEKFASLESIVNSVTNNMNNALSGDDYAKQLFDKLLDRLIEE